MPVLRDLDGLAAAGLVPGGVTPALRAVADRYAIAITPTMAELIDPADPDDPIARQFVPTEAEGVQLPQEQPDPIGDTSHSPVPGIVHRYPDRVLLKLLHACPVYCRFCFRREMVGPGGDALSGEALATALAYIREHPAIWEVILTGGDPLMLSPRRLAEVIAALGEIDHLGLVRLHTRVPVVEPERVSDALVAALRGAKATWLLLHTNHPRELTSAAAAAIGRLVDGGIPVLSQSVLLRGVNDTPETLSSLMRRLVELRVKPHYLHQGDLAPGTAQFRVPIAEGQALVAGLRGHLSGLCQPTYLLDLPGGHGKVPLAAAAVQPDGDGWLATDWQGGVHRYRDDTPATA